MTTDLEDLTNDMQGLNDAPSGTERLDQISMFLQFIQTNRPINQIVGKEKSIGYIQEEHMAGHIKMDRLIMMFLAKGQIRKAYELIYSVMSEFRMTMSIEGKFVGNITKQELRYTHTQHLINDQPQPQEKKGFWRRK